MGFSVLSYEPPQKTSVDELLNLFFQLMAFLRIIPMISMETTILVLTPFVSWGLYRSRFFQVILILNGHQNLSSRRIKQGEPDWTPSGARPFFPSSRFILRLLLSILTFLFFLIRVLKSLSLHYLLGINVLGGSAQYSVNVWGGLLAND